jgi:hypothetical protein
MTKNAESRTACAESVPHSSFQYVLSVQATQAGKWVRVQGARNRQHQMKNSRCSTLNREPIHFALNVEHLSICYCGLTVGALARASGLVFCPSAHTVSA